METISEEEEIEGLWSCESASLDNFSCGYFIAKHFYSYSLILFVSHALFKDLRFNHLNL